MGCNGCIKLFVVLFNILLLVFGLALVAMGIGMKAVIGDYWEALSNWQTSAPIMMIIVGLCVILISIFGMVAACKESRCLILLFGIILIAMFILQLSVVFVALIGKSKIEANGESMLNTALEKAYTNVKSHKVNTVLFDKMQKNLNCCGVSGKFDYIKLNKTIPATCCLENTPCSITNAFDKGCARSMKDIVSKNFKYIAASEMIFCLANIFQIILVFSLFTRLVRYSPV